MNIYMIVLRFFHVVSAVCWAGGAIVFSQFVEPSVKATAPESQKFMQYLMNRRGFSKFMGIVSILTVVAGALLYWNDSMGFQSGWITSGSGIGFTIGAIFGISVAIYGNIAIGARAGRMQKIGQEIAAADGKPTPEQLAELKELDEGMTRAGRVDFVLILIALIAMATARYW